MSRSNQQMVRLLQQLIRMVQSGKLSVRWLIGLAALAVGYFLLQPVLERSLGIDLPGLGDVATSSQSTSDAPRSTPRSKTQGGSTTSVEIEQILQASSREVYLSPAGLRYTRGSQHGHRLKHLMAHSQDEPDRPGQHGVFDSTEVLDVIALVDEAYLQAQAGRDTRVQQEEERTVYDVNLRRRVGYIGGTSGKRKGHPAAKHVRLVLEGKRFITAFPVRP